MAELAETAPIAAPLTEVQRVVDTFVAPTKTFTDLRRNATFWGPLIILIIVGVVFAFSVQQKVGWERTVENVVHTGSQASAEKFDTAPESAKAIAAKITAASSYGFAGIFLLITLVTALLVWATVNFGFGGKARYAEIYAVTLYAGLVINIKYILAIIAIFAGLAPDSFLIKNPVGTNIGYYLSTDAPKALAALCMHLDIFEIWSLVLSVIGVSVVARVSRGKAAAVVVGWWVIFVLIGVGVAAVQS